MIRRSTWIILGIFILLSAATFFWQKFGKEAEAKATPTTEQDLLLNLTSKVTGLRIEGVGSDIVEVSRDAQGQWKLTIPAGQETDTGAVEAAVSQLSSLRILSAFEQGLDLGGAGLVVPSYRITTSLEDGESIVLNIGKATATGSGYYVQMGEKGIYVVSKYSLDSIIKLLQNPPIKPTSTSSVGAETIAPETAIPSLSTEIPSLTTTP